MTIDINASTHACGTQLATQHEQGKVEKETLPRIEGTIQVRVEGKVLAGVVTGYDSKDGKPIIHYEYDHLSPDGSTTKGQKWAWPEQLSDQPSYATLIATALPSTEGYEKGFKDAHESLCLALTDKVSPEDHNDVITTALNAYANNAEVAQDDVTLGM